MKKTTNEIVAQIRALLNELEGAPAGTAPIQKYVTKSSTKKATNCIGAIQELVGEGFFDEPKGMPQIMDKLKKRGQTSFKNTSVSMNLLNLVKPPKQILERDGTPKKWVYSKRK
jgi:hypothetical protein